MGAEVGWHLRFVQAREIDVWAKPSQAPIFEELAATFGQWSLTREEVDGAVCFRFSRTGAAKEGQ